MVDFLPIEILIKKVEFFQAASSTRLITIRSFQGKCRVDFSVGNALEMMELLEDKILHNNLIGVFKVDQDKR